MIATIIHATAVPSVYGQATLGLLDHCEVCSTCGLVGNPFTGSRCDITYISACTRISYEIPMPKDNSARRRNEWGIKLRFTLLISNFRFMAAIFEFSFILRSVRVLSSTLNTWVMYSFWDMCYQVFEDTILEFWLSLTYSRSSSVYVTS